MPKHDFHDYIHTIILFNRTHHLCHLDISGHKNGINNGFDLTIVIFL